MERMLTFEMLSAEEQAKYVELANELNQNTREGEWVKEYRSREFFEELVEASLFPWRFARNQIRFMRHEYKGIKILFGKGRKIVSEYKVLMTTAMRKHSVKKVDWNT